MDALDPVLVLNDHSLLDGDSDSGCEYEYHESETETVYLNLDLSSLHGPLRPPRRRPNANANAGHAHNHGDDKDLADFARPVETTESGIATTNHRATVPADDDRLQILGLHTLNPIVSYQNQVFSCSWAEQLGTELFFTPPGEIPTVATDSVSRPEFAAPLTRGKGFDLVAANSVKLLGRKANLISSSGVTAASEPSTATSANTTTTTTTTTNRQTNQARFLERLAQIKQAKGETDPVRTVFSLRRTQNLDERLQGWARTEEQMAEIQQLQDGAQRGDPQAMAAWEQLYYSEADH